ncbi:MAG: OadG family protein [Bacillota bacterium]
MSPLELIRDADRLAEMSLGQSVLAAVQVALVGMIVVFAILFILLLAIKVMEKVVYAGSPPEGKGPKSKKKKQNKSETKATSRSDENQPEDSLDPKLVAVITAAIQDYYDGKQEFKILRIKRKSEHLSAWGREARGGRKQ